MRCFESYENKVPGRLILPPNLIVSPGYKNLNPVGKDEESAVSEQKHEHKVSLFSTGSVYMGGQRWGVGKR